MLSKISVVLTFLLFATHVVFSQDILESIPEELLKGASIITLDELLEFDIIDDQHSKETYKISYIVLKDGVKITEQIFFSEFNKIKRASVKVYDKHNKLIEKYKSSDFREHLNNHGSISTDSGTEYLSLPHFTPPYKVIFEYEVKNKFSLFYPQWNPIDKTNESILHSSLIVNDYSRDNLRYKGYNIDHPTIDTTKKWKKYIWSIDNVAASVQEPYDNENDYLPKVLLAANRVYADGYEGEINSWNNIGRFIKKLNSARNDFSEEDKIEILSIVKDAKSNREKVELIYAYLQGSTRYASIQLGIGGWRPFETSFTHKKKYGDCKGLSFYTKSMLDLIGVPSFYTLVRAKKHASKVPCDFPSLSFNHAFLMVPLENDTVWLECTSQTTPFGFLGYFTNDRNVLVMTDDGGRLVRTKVYTAEENMSSFNVKMKIVPNGDTYMDVHKTMIGLEIMNDNFFYYTTKNKRKQKNWIYDNFDIGNFEILSFDFKPMEKAIIPKSEIDVSILKPNFGKLVGDRMLVTPFVFNKIDEFRLIQENRKHPLYLPEAFLQKEEVILTIPEGYIVEKMAKDISIETEYGNYNLSFRIDKNDIHCYRKLKVNKGRYPAEEYDEIKNYFDRVLHNDQRRIVLKKSP